MSLWLFGILFCSLLLSGCATIDFQALNDRHVRSCWKYQGAYGLFVGMVGITMTGDMTTEDCLVLLRGE